MGTALKHLIERAATEHLPAFEAWFPSCFDWARMCEDVPEMARRSGEVVEDERELESWARAVFKASHLFTLTILAAASEGAADPDVILEHLTSPPSDAEEEVFEARAVESLPAAEERLAGWEGPGEDDALEDDAPADVPAGDERAVASAVSLVRVTWPAVEHLLASDEGRIFERAGPTAGVLWGVGRVGALLAAFRWQAAEAVEETWPSLDPGGGSADAG